MEHENGVQGTSRRKMLVVGGTVLAGTLAGCSLTSDDGDGSAKATPGASASQWPRASRCWRASSAIARSVSAST